jgi:chaperonin GroES
MTSHIKPLGSRILVKRSEAKVSRGGIILPDSAQEKPKEGEVVAVGPGKMNEEGNIETMHVQVGDTVLFSSYAGTELTDAEGYLIMSQDDVLAVKVNI